MQQEGWCGMAWCPATARVCLGTLPRHGVKPALAGPVGKFGFKLVGVLGALLEGSFEYLWQGNPNAVFAYRHQGMPVGARVLRTLGQHIHGAVATHLHEYVYISPHTLCAVDGGSTPLVGHTAPTRSRCGSHTLQTAPVIQLTRRTGSMRRSGVHVLVSAPSTSCTKPGDCQLHECVRTQHRRGRGGSSSSSSSTRTRTRTFEPGKGFPARLQGLGHGPQQQQHAHDRHVVCRDVACVTQLHRLRIGVAKLAGVGPTERAQGLFCAQIPTRGRHGSAAEFSGSFVPTETRQTACQQVGSMHDGMGWPHSHVAHYNGAFRVCAWLCQKPIKPHLQRQQHRQ